MAQHYMNKFFGHGLDRARRLDEQEQEHGKAGHLKRVTIEPDHEGGGHRVIVERHTVVMGMPKDGEDGGRTEHSFGTDEDALHFLASVLGGKDPDAAQEADEGIRGPKQRGGPGDMMGHDKGGDEGIDRGGIHDADFLGRILAAGRGR